MHTTEVDRMIITLAAFIERSQAGANQRYFVL
jgi:hypothetical protein